MKRFYYTTDGSEVFGPVDKEALLRLLHTGQIPPNTQVCQEGYSAWRSIESVDSNGIPAIPTSSGGGAKSKVANSPRSNNGPKLLSRCSLAGALLGAAIAQFGGAGSDSSAISQLWINIQAAFQGAVAGYIVGVILVIILDKRSRSRPQ